MAFFKALKLPNYGVIKTLCAKNKVCKSISMTCSTYRRITKDKEENTPKWPKKAPQRAKNCIFFSCPKEYYAKKNQVPRSKTVTSSGRTHTHRQTDRQTEVLKTEDLSLLARSEFSLQKSSLFRNPPRSNTTNKFKAINIIITPPDQIPFMYILDVSGSVQRYCLLGS